MSNNIFFCTYIFLLNITFLFFNFIIAKNLISTLSIKRKFTSYKSLGKFDSSKLFDVAKIMFDRGLTAESYILFSLSDKISSKKDNVSQSLIYFYLGQINYKSNNFDKALFFLRKSLNRSSGFNNARYLLIQLYYKKRLFYNLARQSSLKYCGYQANNSEVRSILESVDRDDRI